MKYDSTRLKRLNGEREATNCAFRPRIKPGHPA